MRRRSVLSTWRSATKIWAVPGQALESRWNSALARVGDLERSLAELETESATAIQPDRDALLRLTKDLPAVWNASIEIIRQMAGQYSDEDVMWPLDRRELTRPC